MTLKVSLLGSISFEVDGQPVRCLPTRAAQALLIYVLHQSRPVPREQLIDLFFQSSEPKQAAANLRSLLSRMKKELSPFLDMTRYSVGIKPDASIVLDSAEFSRSITQPNTSLQQTLNHYHGDFLAGFYLRDAPEFELWALTERERLRLLAVDGLQRLIALAVASADHTTTLQTCERLLSIEPLLEHVHQQKMLALARAGQRSLALKQYQTVTTLLASELAVEPQPATTQLYERIKRSTQPPTNNLPPARGPFIGRTQSLHAISQHLAQPTNRLMTLLGPGGVGKTRLALEVGRNLLASAPGMFLDGIAFAALETVTTPDLLPITLAATLNMPLRGQAAAAEQLLAWLADRELLLILDNFEQLVAQQTINFLIQLLTQCPYITLLVTSRERLHIYEETVVDIAGLDLPFAEDARTVEALRQNESADLFLTHVERQRFGFVPSAEDNSAIVTICRQLDGVPLALELAAGSIRQLSCVEIARHIGSNLDFLGTSFHNMPDRQRSLRAVFEHSWTLLDVQDQQQFAQLSVFASAFEAERANAVLGITTDTLRALRDKSLLQHEKTTGYTLHPLLRQYAAEKLDSWPQLAQAARAAHAEWFEQWLVELNNVTISAEQFLKIDRCIADLRISWVALIAEAAFGRLQHMAQTFFEYYSWGGNYRAGIDQLQAAIDLIRRAGTDTLALASLLSLQGRLLTFTSDLKQAAEQFDEAIALQEAGDAGVTLSGTYGNRAITSIYQSDYANARRFAEKGLAIAMRFEDEEGVAFTSNLLGSITKSQGDFAASRDYFTAALAIRQRKQDTLGVAFITHNLGTLALDQGDYEVALPHLLRSVEMLRDINHPHGIATALSNAALTCGNMGDYARAEQLQRESLAIKRTIGDQRSIAISLITLADSLTYQQRFDAAAAILDEAEGLISADEMREAFHDLTCARAHWHIQRGDSAEAHALLTWLKAETVREVVSERISQLLAQVHV